jgi:superfamily I DNA and RNA helicase
MSNSFFFLQVEKTTVNRVFIEQIEEFASSSNKQFYVIDKPLGENRYTYNFKNGIVLLSPNYRIVFVNFGSDKIRFSEYIEDFIEDLGSISDKYTYRNVLDRPRVWRNEIISIVHYSEIHEPFQDFIKEFELTDPKIKKKCELLISLLTGSINDIQKVKGDVPTTLLDKIKQKIQLFDGDQTRFIYQSIENKKTTIQGLSGTGKTELLLHKLKEIYVGSENSKVMFTCHNIILADTLRKRIPGFFDFMKVEQQIKWDERLWCVHSWGSQSNEHSGTYSYICKFYNLTFQRYSRYGNSFERICKEALNEIKKNKLVNIFGFAFDYILIDESQDLPDSFFDICEIIAKEKVYIAGDIFQGIFDNNIVSEINPNFLLNKCYRTDPKTLMFAHALGMGLFEKPVLRWLNEKEWSACGYLIDYPDPKTIKLSRESLRRFEDLEIQDYSSIELVNTSIEENETAESKIIEIIREIKEENDTVQPDDIGIIFVDRANYIYQVADNLEVTVPRKLGWEVNKATESKRKIPGKLFISNVNNVKGLEFPFVICVTEKINNLRNYRNSLYMTLTRSFLRSYLLISKSSNLEISPKINAGLKELRSSGNLLIDLPSDKEMINARLSINFEDEKLSLFDFVYQTFDTQKILPMFQPKLYDVVKTAYSEDSDDYNEEDVVETIVFHYEMLTKQKR